ncbi:MAG TPA: PmoA family protein [bacterium]|nr:PmoA family protein [bacterium]HQQ00340.1 PmoA family protein [bacterium]
MTRYTGIAIAAIFVCAVLAPAVFCDSGIQEIVIKNGKFGQKWCPINIPVDKVIAPGDLQYLKCPDGIFLSVQVRPEGTGSVITFIPPKLEADQILRLIPATASGPEQRMQVRKAADYRIDVTAGDTLITSYCFQPDSEKPYLYPVIGPKGTHLTRGFPMENLDFEKELKAQDHPHHRSFWVSYGDVNGGDFWMMGKDIQKTDEIAVAESGAVYGRILAKNSWMKADGQRCVSEQREYLFYNTPEEARVIDSVVTFTATDGDALFGATKEGGICSFRLNPKIDESHGNGVMRNSEGGQGAKECWAHRAAWCDYYGTLDGNVVGIAVFDHPTNLRYPTWWHIRDYGLYSANCFGLRDFFQLPIKSERDQPNKHVGDYLLPAGKSLTFNYRVVLHAGDTDQARIADRFAGYATPPQAEIVWKK